MPRTKNDRKAARARAKVTPDMLVEGIEPLDKDADQYMAEVKASRFGNDVVWPPKATDGDGDAPERGR